jgi:hypothetical protein
MAEDFPVDRRRGHPVAELLTDERLIALKHQDIEIPVHTPLVAPEQVDRPSGGVFGSQRVPGP